MLLDLDETFIHHCEIRDDPDRIAQYKSPDSATDMF